MKKILSILLLLALVTAVFAGCSSQKKEETTSPISGLEIGQAAPDFEVKLLSGETVKLSDYKGKVVLINFWATWCSGCIDELPDVEKIHSEYKDTLMVLAIDAGGELEKDVAAFAKENAYTFPMAAVDDTPKGYDIEYIPANILVDKEGNVRFMKVGTTDYSTFKTEIDKLL